MSDTISVIVPTRYRPRHVVRAVRSALDQSLPPHEVIVVVDGPDPETVSALAVIDDSRLSVVVLSENKGAAHARNVGVCHSVADWVAFLDDDDEWLPEKLRVQARIVGPESHDERLVLATGVERRGDLGSDLWPLRAPHATELVSDYLFVRRRPGEGLLQTSTIMLRRDFASAHPLPEHLPIHEEWDWFISLEKAGGRFVVAMEPLVIYNAPGEHASVSSSSNARWGTSLAWALSRQQDMSKRAFSDFCLTEVARLAQNTGGLRAKATVFLVATEGTLHWFSVARFLAICLIPNGVRRRISADVSRKTR